MTSLPVRKHDPAQEEHRRLAQEVEDAEVAVREAERMAEAFGGPGAWVQVDLKRKALDRANAKLRVFEDR